MKKAVIFDLDGTLLPMDQDAFTRGYFKLLAQKLAPHGYDPAALVDNIWAGTAAMVGNDGKRTNEAAFWDRFAALYGEQVREDIPLFDAFYRQEFQQAKAFCGQNPKAREVVAACKKAGYPVVLTMHRAKGTEFTRVLLFGLSKDSMPMGLKAYDYDDEELSEAQLRERSLLYVAASRARDELVVTYSGTPSSLLPASQ